MSGPENRQKTLIFICSVLFLDAAGFSLIMPIMPDLISGMAELSNAQGELQGAITSLYSIASVLSPPVMALMFTACSDGTGQYLPGAPFLLAAALVALSMLVATLAFWKLNWQSGTTTDQPVLSEK